MSRPLWQVESAIEEDYLKWLRECTGCEDTPPISPGDVFHFLYMKGFIKGKKFLDFIDSLPKLSMWQYMELGAMYPLREGHIPADTRIGRKL